MAKFTAVRTHCRCHPETCACASYYVEDDAGNRLGSHNSEQEADELVSLLDTIAQEAVARFAISVEKLLCAALGREWGPNLSIESLISELKPQPLQPLAVPSQSLPAAPRTWRAEPDGANDRAIEIWYNNKWVPAYFSDIQKGDFYLDLSIDLEPGRCFFAASNVCRNTNGNRPPTFVIVRGSEIVQAPAIKDITPLSLPTDKLVECVNRTLL